MVIDEHFLNAVLIINKIYNAHEDLKNGNESKFFKIKIIEYSNFYQNEFAYFIKVLPSFY